MSKNVSTLLSVLTAPIWLPTCLALEAVDTLVFRDRTSLGNDFHAKASNAVAAIADEPKPFDEASEG